MEILLLVIVLVLNGIMLFWMGALSSRLSAFASSQVDPKELQKSVNKTVKTQIEKSFKAPVDISAFIEHTKFQLEAQQPVTSRSRMEEEIIRYVGNELFGEGCVQETPLFVEHKGGNGAYAKHIQFTLGDA